MTCLVRVGRPRPTVLKAVVCGPCWAAHGGRPDAGEIGPTPDLTIFTCDPVDQRHWVRALRRQSWVQDIRIDGRRNLLTVATLLALYADWRTLESRPTWAKLIERSGVHERTVARWLQELRVRGWLVLLEGGSTPDTRPMTLAYLRGNRAAVYALRIPLAPEEALARAEQELVHELELSLRERSEREPKPSAHPADSSPDQGGRDGVGDENVSPSNSFQDSYLKSQNGTSRARRPVDKFTPPSPDLHKQQPSALRAGSDQRQSPDLSILVPVSRYEMLVAADWLRRRLPVFARCSRKLVRHLCRPYWHAGWTCRDIVHAMDYRPSVFGQHPGLLISPERPASPAQFIRSRLRAWHAPNGTIRPGYGSSRVTDAAAAGDARRRVAERHGAAGARLLRADERVLTAEHIAEHGRLARVDMRASNEEPSQHPAARARAERQAEHRAEQDRLRKQLVAKARAELGRDRPDLQVEACGASWPSQPADPAGSVSGDDVVQRARRYARLNGKASTPRGRRRTSW